MQASRRDLLRGLAGATLAPALAAQTQNAKRPNFLVIVTDDQGIGDVGCYGHPEVRTPNLDRLAASGMRFTQWYANAPVCSASRAAIMTGKYPDRTGVKGALPSEPSWDVNGLRQGEQTLPGLLRDRGYRTAAFGKWHLGSAPQSRPRAQGFDDFFGWYSGWLDAYSHRYYQLGGPPGKIFHDLWRNDTEVFEEPAYMTELLGREAQAYLAKQSDTQPFLLYLAFGAPHYSMMAPKKYLERFPASMERDRRMHLAMVAAVDDVVGALLDQLKRQGLESNTVVYYQADNGATREGARVERWQALSRRQQRTVPGLQTRALRWRYACAGIAARSGSAAGAGLGPAHDLDGSSAYVSGTGRSGGQTAFRPGWTEYPASAEGRIAGA